MGATRPRGVATSERGAERKQPRVRYGSSSGRESEEDMLKRI